MGRQRQLEMSLLAPRWPCLWISNQPCLFFFHGAALWPPACERNARWLKAANLHPKKQTPPTDRAQAYTEQSRAQHAQKGTSGNKPSTTPRPTTVEHQWCLSRANSELGSLLRPHTFRILVSCRTTQPLTICFALRVGSSHTLLLTSTAMCLPPRNELSVTIWSTLGSSAQDLSQPIIMWRPAR